MDSPTESGARPWGPTIRQFLTELKPPPIMVGGASPPVWRGGQRQPCRLRSSTHARTLKYCGGVLLLLLAASLVLTLLFALLAAFYMFRPSRRGHGPDVSAENSQGPARCLACSTRMVASTFTPHRCLLSIRSFRLRKIVSTGSSSPWTTPLPANGSPQIGRSALLSSSFVHCHSYHSTATHVQGRCEPCIRVQREDLRLAALRINSKTQRVQMKEIEKITCLPL